MVLKIGFQASRKADRTVVGQTKLALIATGAS